MTLTNPYDGAEGLWYRGNLHTHTTNSDGRLSPDEVIALYAEEGHDFLAISDHDVYTPVFTHDTLTGVPGVEVSAGGPHLLAIGVEKTYDTSRPRGAVIDEIMADGGLCVLCHPNWLKDFNHWDQAAMEAVGPYHGIEIFNSVIDFLEGEAHACDRWDMLLSKGRKVWGFAHDDFHAPGHGPRGWNVVRSPSPTWPALVAAMKAGQFYASTGVTIQSIELDGSRLTVVSPDAAEIRFMARWGVMRACVEEGMASYDIQGNEGYVRAECYGRGKRAAWTQPIFVAD